MFEELKVNCLLLADSVAHDPFLPPVLFYFPEIHALVKHLLAKQLDFDASFSVISITVSLLSAPVQNCILCWMTYDAFNIC